MPRIARFKADLAQPQLRQGDRHRRRPAATRRGDAAVLMDADLQHPPELIARVRRSTGARATTSSTASASTATPTRFAASLGRARLLRRLPEAERHRAAGGRRRLPPARPQGGRRHEPHARARAVQQGPVRLDGLPLGRRAVHVSPPRRERRLALAAAPAAALRARRHRLVHHHSAAGVVLPRAGRSRCSPSATPWSSWSRR